MDGETPGPVSIGMIDCRERFVFLGGAIPAKVTESAVSKSIDAVQQILDYLLLLGFHEIYVWRFPIENRPGYNGVSPIYLLIFEDKNVLRWPFEIVFMVCSGQVFAQAPAVGLASGDY